MTNGGPIQEVAKVATTAVDAMKGAPLAIALLVVNVGFLGFAAYLLGEVATNAKERNRGQLELISNLVRDIRDCRQGPRVPLQPNNYSPNKSMLVLPPMKLDPPMPEKEK